MILKERTIKSVNGKFEKAGAAAEEKMAFYLRRYFQDRSDVWVLNDVRISHDGDFAQIDHLVVHTRGVVIIESKSVAGNIIVTADGQWIRAYGDKQYGMQSPIVQAELQGLILCKNFNEYHRNDYAGEKVPSNIWPYIKDSESITKIVAISDKGIYHQNQERKHANLMKADAVCSHITDLIKNIEAPEGYDEETLRASAKERANYLFLASEICILAETLEPLPETSPLMKHLRKIEQGDEVAVAWTRRVWDLYNTKGGQDLITKLGYTPVIEEMCRLASYAAHEKLVDIKSLELHRALLERREKFAIERGLIEIPKPIKRPP